MRLLPLGLCVFLLASFSAAGGASANPCSYEPRYPSEPCEEYEPRGAREPYYDRERYRQPCPFCGPPRPFYWQDNGCRANCDWYRPRRKTYHWPRPCNDCEEEQGYPEPEPCGGDCADHHPSDPYPGGLRSPRCTQDISPIDPEFGGFFTQVLNRYLPVYDRSGREVCHFEFRDSVFVPNGACNRRSCDVNVRQSRGPVRIDRGSLEETP